jgi:hypothetical protein
MGALYCSECPIETKLCDAFSSGLGAIAACAVGSKETSYLQEFLTFLTPEITSYTGLGTCQLFGVGE